MVETIEDPGGYKYVDFASRALRGFRNHVVGVGELPFLISRYGSADSFATYFLFDRGICDHVRGNHHSVSGYRGPCYACWLPMDTRRA